MSSPGAVQGRRPGRRRRLRGGLAFYGFLSPWLIGTAALTLFPVGYAVYLSFTDWNGMTSFKPWVGLANYQQVLTSGDTLSTLSKTLVLTAVVVPVTIIGSLLLAMLLNRRMRFPLRAADAHLHPGGSPAGGSGADLEGDLR